MSSTHPDFPLSQWCKNFEKGNINLNILQPSRLNPKLSAYAQVFGAFDYQKKPLPPPGIKVLAHVLPHNRCSFELHTIKGFSVGVAMEHCCCFDIFIPSTGEVRIDDTVRWFPHVSLKLPIPTKDKFLRRSIDDLHTTLQLYVKNNSLPSKGTTSRENLLFLNENLKNFNLCDTPTKTPTPNDVPKVIFQSKDATIVPRVQPHSNNTTRVTRVQPPDTTTSPQPKI